MFEATGCPHDPSHPVTPGCLSESCGSLRFSLGFADPDSAGFPEPSWWLLLSLPDCSFLFFTPKSWSGPGLDSWPFCLLALSPTPGAIRTPSSLLGLFHLTRSQRHLRLCICLKLAGSRCPGPAASWSPPSQCVVTPFVQAPLTPSYASPFLALHDLAS